MITIGVMVVNISENNMVRMKERDGKTLVTSFRSIVESATLFHSASETINLQNLVNVFAMESGASEVIIANDRFSIIADYVSRDDNIIGVDNNLRKSISENLDYTYLKKGRALKVISIYESLSVYSPMIVNGKVSGGLKVVFPLTELNNTLLRTKWLLLFFLSFDLLVLLLFGSYLLTRRIVLPLSKFAKAAENIANGDLSERVDDYGENELGQLSTAFNIMADSLSDHVGYLQRANRELRQTRLDLIRSEKLASVGRLAAGVAHEIGNPLGAILGYTNMLISGVDDKAMEKDFVERVEKEVKKIDLTIRELLDYSRPSSVEMRDVNVNGIIHEALSLVSHQKGFESLELELKLLEGLPHILADEHQVRQILLNLILNAVDAMPNGGRITVSTEAFYLSEDKEVFPPRRKEDHLSAEFTIRKRVKPEGGKEWIKVSIADTGMGMEKEELGKIFDPFYTTKDPGKGTGLGLSISQTIIETFDGKIEVESEPGRGTVFSLLLPACEKKNNEV